MVFSHVYSSKLNQYQQIAPEILDNGCSKSNKPDLLATVLRGKGRLLTQDTGLCSIDNPSLLFLTASFSFSLLVLSLISMLSLLGVDERSFKMTRKGSSFTSQMRIGFNVSTTERNDSKSPKFNKYIKNVLFC